MDSSVRAYRILARLKSYEIGRVNENFPEVPDLGDLLGCYRNPPPKDNLVAFYSLGLAWRSGVEIITAKYAEMTEVALNQEKASLGLIIDMTDGRRLQLPISGGNGRFHDSMEVLRFLDRVRKTS